MTEDRTKPTKQQAVESLVRLGQALDEFTYPRSKLGLRGVLRPHEAKRLKSEIEALENIVETAACNLSNRDLRSVLGIRRDQIPDKMDIRILSFVSWHCLNYEDVGASVSRTANAAGLGSDELESVSKILQARISIRRLITRGDVLIFRGTSELLPGWRMIRLLSGGGNKLPIFWTEEDLKQGAEERQRLKNTNGRKRVCSPIKSPAPLDSLSPANVPASVDLGSPKAIYEALRQTVIGMDPVVKKFSVQMAMHMKRVAIMASGGENTTPPVCCLLTGPSGSGKTFLAEEFGGISGMPFAVGNMAEVSSSSYVGTSIDELFYGFIRKGVSILDVQNGGILFLDEIDKKKTNATYGQHDSVGEGPQGELLRLLESSGGSRFQIGGKRSNNAARGSIRTDGMAFVLAGAFSGIEEIIQDKRRSRVPLGFSESGGKTNVPPDIREFLLNWFMPELLNRINSVIVVSTPSRPQLIEIALGKTGIIVRQNQFLSSFGLQINPSQEAIKGIASWALETKTFARGMRNLLQSLVEEAIFDERKGTLEISDTDVRRAIQGLRQEPEGLLS